MKTHHIRVLHFESGRLIIKFDVPAKSAQLVIDSILAMNPGVRIETFSDD